MDQTLAELRADAESRMHTEFAVMVTVDDEPEWILVDGEEVPNLALAFFTPGRVKSTRSYGNLNQEVGGTTATTVTREWHIPVSAPEVPQGAVVVVVTSPATADPTLQGARFRVSGVTPGDQGTARRLEITERIA